MKRFIFAMAILAAYCICTNGCKKEDEKPVEETYTCTSCTTTPEAVAANDASSKGIYKGIITGSSGTIKFNLKNTNNSITAVMVLDGITVNLVSSVQLVNGEP